MNLLLLATTLGAIVVYGRALRYLTRSGAETSPRLVWISLAILLYSMVGGVAWIWLLAHSLKNGEFSVGPLGLLLALPAFGETFRFDALLDPKLKPLAPLPRSQMVIANSTLSFLLGCALWDILRRSLHLTTPDPLILLATLLAVAILLGNARLLPGLLYQTEPEQRRARRAAGRMAILRANLIFCCYGLVYLASCLPFALLPSIVREYAGAALFTTFWLAPAYWVRFWDAKIENTLGTEAVQAASTVPQIQSLPSPSAKTTAEAALRTVAQVSTDAPAVPAEIHRS